MCIVKCKSEFTCDLMNCVSAGNGLGDQLGVKCQHLTNLQPTPYTIGTVRFLFLSGIVPLNIKQIKTTATFVVFIWPVPLNVNKPLAYPCTINTVRFLFFMGLVPLNIEWITNLQLTPANLQLSHCTISTVRVVVLRQLVSLYHVNK